MAGDCLIKIGDIRGESQDKDYNDLIDVLSFTWGLSSNHTGKHTQRRSMVNVQNMSFSKYIDCASSQLVNSGCVGICHPEAKLIVRKSGGKKLEYLTFAMKYVFVTSVDVQHIAESDMVTENVALSFAEFTFCYRQQDRDGNQIGGVNEASWKIDENRAG